MQAMSREPDVIVVGSGPAGVSVTFPMLDAGMKVLLVDGGRTRDLELLREGPYHALRREDHEQWRIFLGKGLEALRQEGPPTPKFDAPGSRFAFEAFAESQRITGDQFNVTGSLARGGLSNIWGAGLATYSDEDLEGFPISASDLMESYRRISARMGVTGFTADDLSHPTEEAVLSQPHLPLAAGASALLGGYERRRAKFVREGVRLGRARNAVLTETQEKREACGLCDMCLWGCARRSIWSAAYDLELLQSRDSFDYRPGHVVEKIEPGGSEFRVRVRRDDAGERQTLSAPILVLAAGALATTRLVLDMDNRYGQPVPVLGTPMVGFALCLPAMIGTPLAERQFSMAQLSFEADGREATSRASGNLFTASGLPASLLIARMPLTRPGAVELYRYLQPALLLGNCFLGSSYCDSWARLERVEDGPTLRITGGFSTAFPERLRWLRRQLGRAFSRAGAYVLPHSFTPGGPGDDLRYGGTLPMSHDSRPGTVDPDGRLHSHEHLHIVDLSIFPRLSAKPPVLTMMANADRIGRGIAARWSGGAT